MKHTTRAIAAVLAGLSALLCTACSTGPAASAPDSAAETTFTDDDSEYETIVAVETDAPTEMAVNSEANAAEAANEDADVASYGFRSAVWLAKDPETDTERYFRFYDDHNGVVLNQENGMGVGFTCDLTADSGTFHFGAPDASETVKFIWNDADSLSLIWDSGKREGMLFLRENGVEEYPFFSNEQLAAMALDYYEGHTGYRPSMAATIINLDEQIAIQLYDVVGDHISTSDWYTVDRYTAAGTNVTGDPVDLTQPVPAGAVPAETLPGETAPVQTVPGETAPVQAVPGETVPGETVPGETVPAVS